VVAIVSKKVVTCGGEDIVEKRKRWRGKKWRRGRGGEEKVKKWNRIYGYVLN
jgi:hypothetical protein